MKKKKNNLFAFLLVSLLALFTVDYSSLLKSDEVVTANWSSNYASSFDSGSGTQSSPHIIKTPAQLARMIYVINVYSSYTNYNSDYYYLANNINMNEYQWVAIGTSSRIFKGFFDGGGNAIYNLRYKNTTSKTENFGLFGFIQNATIKNLFILESTYELSNSSTNIGGFVGNGLNSTYLNLGSNVSIKGSANIVGGIVGTGSGSIQYSFNSGTISLNSTSFAIGGIAGSFSGNAQYIYNNGAIQAGNQVGGLFGGYSAGLSSTNKLKLSYNSGNITTNGTSSGVGGIAGFAAGDETYTTIIEKVYNSGNITATTTGFAIGGIVGQGEYIKITNTYNQGNITATQTDTVSVGGILGTCMETEYELDTVTNKGNIAGYDFTAGIMGAEGTPEYSGATSVYGTITRAFNAGTVTGSNSTGNAAGIIAWVCLNDDGEILNVTRSANIGDISGYSAAGIIGYAFTDDYDTTLVISENYNTGTISGNQYVAGIIAIWQGGSRGSGKDAIYFAPSGGIEKNYNVGHINISVNFGAGILAFQPDWNDNGLLFMYDNYSATTFGNLSVSASYVGGILGGYSDYKVILSENYYLHGDSYDGYPNGGIGTSSTYSALSSAFDRSYAYTQPVSIWETNLFLTYLDNYGFDADSPAKPNDGFPVLTNGTYTQVSSVLDAEFSTSPEINNGNPYLDYFYWFN